MSLKIQHDEWAAGLRIYVFYRWVRLVRQQQQWSYCEKHNITLNFFNVFSLAQKKKILIFSVHQQRCRLKIFLSFLNEIKSLLHAAWISCELNIEFNVFGCWCLSTSWCDALRGNMRVKKVSGEEREWDLHLFGAGSEDLLNCVFLRCQKWILGFEISN